MKVRAPASTANLGPGFDCLGAAVSVALELDLSTADELPKMVRVALDAIAPDAKNVHGAVRSEIPRGRGLGSSAACVAAGLVAGSALAGRDPDPDELLRIGTPIEGHPDNLAAALYGGITLVAPDGSVQRFEPSGGVRPLILVPHESLATKKARQALPSDVPLADAVANAAWTAGLLSMLTGAAAPTREGLFECTQDRLHQPYRAPLMPSTFVVIDRLRADGIAAAVSGAGPSVVCLIVRGAEDDVRKHVPSFDGWKLFEVDWDLEGARVVEP